VSAARTKGLGWSPEKRASPHGGAYAGDTEACPGSPKHFWTTSAVASPFAAVQLRTPSAKRFHQVGNATALIWCLLRVPRQGFRRLDVPELLAAVSAGQRFVGGQTVWGAQGRAVA
jgi:hypothetical protein